MSRISSVGAALIAAALFSQSAHSQSVAVGMVFDSVRLRPMVGARVRLDSSSIFALTDGDGRFRLEGIPDGPHRLRVEHPIVDTLGIQMWTPVASFAGSETKVVEIATPSQESLVGVMCSAALRARGPAVLIGKVREADTGNPAVGARISLVWYEISALGGVRKLPRERIGTVGPDGIYRICGLPAQLEGKAQVIRGGVTSGDVAVEFGEDLVALRSLSIAQAGTISTEATPTATDTAARSGPVEAPPPARIFGTAKLTGRVVNKAKAPIEGVHVQLDGANRGALTRANGEFTLDSVPAGTQTVSVRKLGFAMTETAVDLSSKDVTRVVIEMEDYVPMLETVRVNASRDKALDDVGYARRKRLGNGYFMDGDKLETREMSKFSDIVRQAPGISVVRKGDRQFIQSSRDPVNGCVIFWIDGTQWQQLEAGDIDDFVPPGQVVAIESYSASATPPEYSGVSRGSCQTIVVWTVRKIDRKRKP